MRRVAKVGLAILLLGALAAPAPAAGPDPVEPYRQGDTSIVALNILPPGQGRYLNSGEEAQAQANGNQPAMNTNQMDLYTSLIKGAPGVTAVTLSDFFKDESFGVKPEDIDRQYSPRPGVEVIRDKPYEVPHVYGVTRADTMFGAGYVSAEDRMFMMDVLRHIGRGNSSEFLGASPENLAMDRQVYKSAGYTEKELQKMIDRLPKIDPKRGPTVVKDLQDYTDGVNQYFSEARQNPTKLPAEYPALQLVPQDWKPTDTVAVASLIGSQLGVGGGAELQNARFLEKLQRTHKSRQKAQSIYDDFRVLKDPEAPTTTNHRFPYLTDLGPVNPKSIAMPDHPGRVVRSAASAASVVTGPFGPINVSFPDGMSNALLVGKSLSKTGHPLAVFGPQTGYFSPEILMEMDLHGPGIATRGVGFPGISLYTLIGRGTDYAWSATSANGDQVDTFAEKLCRPDGSKPGIHSAYYLKDGKCTKMYKRTDSWAAKPTAGGQPCPDPSCVEVSMTTRRTDNGIVQARGRVHGIPVAFVHDRSSFKREVDSALTYYDMANPNHINGPKDFQRAFGRFAFSFNWFYLDKKHIAYVRGGYYPHRRKGTSDSLPLWGTGKWDWKKRNLSYAELAKDIDPAKGWMTSWNNKPAPGWGAADDVHAYGPIYRSQLLDDRIQKYAKDGKVSLVELVNAMGDAATVDLRGDKVLPYMLDVVGHPKSPKLEQAVQLLRDWHKGGSHRRSRDNDAVYDDAPAVALMDRWWNPALDAAFGPRLGAALPTVPQNRDDKPGPLGSAYHDGWYGYMQKDLRTVLGFHVRGRFHNVYCGKGSLEDCRKALRGSLAAAVKSLTDDFGADPSGWDADEEGDMIKFRPIGLQGQDPMRWQNRPTFQQVIEFGAPNP
jgi:acyl-homoserine lactone acylase PvdQ